MPQLVNSEHPDIPVLPDHGIVFDQHEREYYNIKTDIFLAEDDIKFYNLCPLSEIPNPVPKDFDFLKYWHNHERR